MKETLKKGLGYLAGLLIGGSYTVFKVGFVVWRTYEFQKISGFGFLHSLLVLWPF